MIGIKLPRYKPVLAKQQAVTLVPPMKQTHYQNPVIPTDFPDPSVIATPSGGYYAYATHDKFSPTMCSIQLSHSIDLVNWSEPVGALAEPPVWGKNCQEFWCPQVVFVDGEYRLYYAAKPDNGADMQLALAKSKTPDRFVDVGKPLTTQSGGGYTMIDPHFFADPQTGRHYLYYGSAHEPIRAYELANDGFTFIGDPIEVLTTRPGVKFETLREGAFVVYKPETKRYFMWVSGDNTWESNGYAVNVYWSDNPLTNFQPIPDNHVILQPGAAWDSPGQNCLVTDAAGQDWIIYHAVDVNDRFIPGTDRFLRKMCMDRVQYTADGWPFIAGNQPSAHPRPGPRVRT